MLRQQPSAGPSYPRIGDFCTLPIGTFTDSATKGKLLSLRLEDGAT
jgi:hypothetical protein